MNPEERIGEKQNGSFAFLFFSPSSLVLFSSLLFCLPSSKKLKPLSLYPLPVVKNNLQATDLTRPPPVSLTAGNKSFPWQLRSWLPPNKNTTVGAIGRAVGSVANSSNPLNATKAVAQGLARYKQETKALILGQAGIVSFVNSVNTSASAGSPITCFVDPSTGQLVGLEQDDQTACSPTGDVTVVPSSAGYISQIKLAYTYDGAFIGRLVFYLKANATAKPVSYTCGSAGGKAVDLLPNDEYVVSGLGVGCASLSAAAGRRRGLLQTTIGESSLSAESFKVTAVPLAALPINPVTGVAQTTILGNILVPENPTPTPAPTMTPVPTTTPAPPTPPTVTQSLANLARNAPTLTIAGSGFDATTPSANTVALSLGAFGAVTSATATSLNVTLSTQPTSLGSLTAAVTSFGGSSGTAVQVATVVAAPTVTQSLANLASSATALTITGTGFDPTAAGNTVVFSSGVAFVSSSTSMSLTLSVTTPPSVGSLTVVVTSFGGSSGAAVTVATVEGPSGLPFMPSWFGIVSSADGTKLAVGVNIAAAGGNIWLSSNSGATWTAQSGGAPTSASWYAIASSSDGTKLAAVAYSGNIWLSSNSGATWTAQSGGAPTTAQWRSIASSSDGTKLAAVATSGTIWLSSNSGATWTAQSGGAPTTAQWNWNSIASSSDGTKLVAVAARGDMWMSSNSGATWTAAVFIAPPTYASWLSIASSANGTKLAAVAYSGNIWLSSNSGATWTAQSGGAPTSGNWRSIASSANGTKLAAVAYSGNIWLSSNSGATWTAQSGGAPTSAFWYAIASSSDGTKLAAVATSGTIWLSSNSGATWTAQSGGAPTSTFWYAIASSSDGTKLAAVVIDGGIWLSSTSGATWYAR